MRIRNISREAPQKVISNLKSNYNQNVNLNNVIPRIPRKPYSRKIPVTSVWFPDGRETGDERESNMALEECVVGILNLINLVPRES